MGAKESRGQPHEINQPGTEQEKLCQEEMGTPSSGRPEWSKEEEDGLCVQKDELK